MPTAATVNLMSARMWALMLARMSASMSASMSALMSALMRALILALTDILGTRLTLGEKKVPLGLVHSVRDVRHLAGHSVVDSPEAQRIARPLCA